jgi:hypothetical protein
MSDDQRRPTATDTEAWLRTELLYWFTGANGLGWSPSTPGLPKRIDSLVELFARAQRRERATPVRARDDWHEDDGAVLWWQFPVTEPPYAGTPLDDDFPEYMTHWTPIVVPEAP